MHRIGTDANTALLGFLGATVVFAVSFATVVQVSVDRGGGLQASDQAEHAVTAALLADLLISSPGRGWYAEGNTCIAGALNEEAFSPESVSRLGLAQERCAVSGDDRAAAGNLSFAKLVNLLQASYDVDATNSAVDYLEARQSLGLDEPGVNFHLRSWPMLPDAVRMLSEGLKDPNQRVLYVGDYNSIGGGGSVPPYVAGFVDQADRVIVYVNITNNGASSTIFDALFEMELKSSKVSFTLHSAVLAAGGSGNLSFTILKTSDWEWKNNNARKVEVEVHDKDTKLADFNIDMASVTMTFASSRTNVFAESEKLNTVLAGPSVEAKYFYGAYNGKGDPVDFGDWTYKLYNSTGGLVRTDVLPTGKEGNVVHAFTQTGTYAAQLWNDAESSLWNQDNVNIADVEPGPYGGGASSYEPAASVVPEAAIIDAVIGLFDKNAFNSTYGHPNLTYAAGGDVYPDIRDAMNNDLPLALTNETGAASVAKYTTLIVGSNVDHNSMTSQAAKGTIRSWVLAGGTLIVFGSVDQSISWLQPLFHVALDSAGGGISVPDTTHPILTTPNGLDEQTYDDHDTAWHFNSADDKNHFTHVVTKDSDDVLAVSDPGAFGEGRVILTSWRLYDLRVGGDGPECDPDDLQASCASLQLLNNFVTFAYQGLYLDYGPIIPRDVPVGAQSRIATVYHPEMGRLVEVYVVVYVFG